MLAVVAVHGGAGRVDPRACDRGRNRLSMAWNGLSFAIAAEIARRREAAPRSAFQQTVLVRGAASRPDRRSRAAVLARSVLGSVGRSCSAAPSFPAAPAGLRRLRPVARPLVSPRATLRPARRALRDRRWPGREPPAPLGSRGRGAPAGGVVVRGGRARGRGRPPRQPLRTCRAVGQATVWVGIASRHRPSGRSLRRSARGRRRDRGGRASRRRLGRRVSWRGGRLHRKPSARRRR